MSEHPSQEQRYMVSIYEQDQAGGALIVTFVPKVPPPERSPGLPAKRVPQFIVTVRPQEPGGLTFDWSATPDQPGAARAGIEAEIADRMKDRTTWVDRVSSLVDQVEQWARAMGWSTRRVEKKLDDARIGKHRVPALLMQVDTCRVLLEPVARSIPGAEGVIDLYLMPAYDDIASLYYYGDRWNLHYVFPDTKAVAKVREAETTPVSRETFEKVLVEMRRHAA